MDYYEERNDPISAYPGLFLKWIKEFPKGKPPNPNEIQTAQEYWSTKWRSLFNGPAAENLHLNQSSHEYPEDQLDARIQSFINVHGGNPRQRHPTHPPIGPASSNDETGTSSENEDIPSDFDDTPESERSRAGGTEDGSESEQSTHSQQSRSSQRSWSSRRSSHSRHSPESRSRKQHPDTQTVRWADEVEDTETSQTNDSSRSGSEQDPPPVYRRVPRDDGGMPRARDAGRWRRHGRGGLRSRVQYRQHSLQSSVYPIHEDYTHISELQHEINTLRRSLNQLALLQG